MKTRAAFAVLSPVLLVAVASAEPPAAEPAAGAPTREIRTEVVVDAPLGTVWAAFTTKAGMESWAVPRAEVDFRVGGKMRTNYNPAAKPDGPGWIVHHFLSLDPKRMFSGRFEAPATAPPAAKRAAEGTWTVTYFEALSPERTKVSLAHLGFGTGPEWDDAYAFFEKGNAWSFEQLKKKVGKPGAAPPAGVQAWPDLKEGRFLARAGRERPKAPTTEWEFRVLERAKALAITVWDPDTDTPVVDEGWFVWWDEVRKTTRVVSSGAAGAVEGAGRWEVDGTLVLEVPVKFPTFTGTRWMRFGAFHAADAFEVSSRDVHPVGDASDARVWKLTKARPEK